MTSKILYLRNLRTEAEHIASGSQIQTDAPTDNHGKGELFSPTDLAATSLASCMITVMGIRAEQEKIPFENLEAEVEKVMVANPRRISQINVTLYIVEDWTDLQKSIMEDVGRNCPVALSLHTDIVQNIEFKYG